MLSSLARSTLKKMIVKPVPCLQDNYAYLLLDQTSKKAAAIDPVEPDNVFKALESTYPDYQLSMILTTHHHWDHAGGNTKFLSKLNVPCYGGSDQVKGVTHIVKANETIQLGNIQIRALATAGHTMDHICYFAQEDNDHAVFTGDCLFSSGCGRFFEGSPSDMWNAFSELLKLPEDTHVYFGHEYTLANLKFAAHVEPDNQDIKDKIKWAQENKCTTPSTLSNEKLTNPFLRVESIGHLIDPSCSSTIELLGKLRKMKDNFK
ncbi:hypothetical protein G6F70_002332 [Rhizopus microsporus]|nr:hypothetical protein G6F71_006340 [Rhizopus microsporus]KAG1202341.1 hypothetical protein G6F70_002332 [Rhizopus microsporus]KAG1207761.1 hypothetical protein G6F69_007780 [Rhizopus microsporus]KAG1236502.1 hypothetical protein G6F67_001927 [Rhizopus microsporus]KAG1260637.1 hypothetical protein G6F68_007293 [Rhizopus microsporus]